LVSRLNREKIARVVIVDGPRKRWRDCEIPNTLEAINVVGGLIEALPTIDNSAATVFINQGALDSLRFTP
jgi:hypothetical protein